MNTTLAFQDNFVSDTELWSKNNLLFVKEKDTTIQIVYPKKTLGIAASVLGLLVAAGLVMLESLRMRKAGIR